MAKILLLLVAALATTHVTHADNYGKPVYMHSPSPSPVPVLVAGTCKDTGYCFPKPISASPSCPSGTQALPNDPTLCWKGSCPQGSTLSHDAHGTPVCLSCPSGYTPAGSSCRQNCPDGYKFDGNDSCVQQCKQGCTSYTYGGKSYCIETCGSGEVSCANMCININKWQSGNCMSDCASSSPSNWPTDIYSPLGTSIAAALQSFDGASSSNSALSTLVAALGSGNDFASKDVYGALYGAMTNKGCNCNAVRTRAVQVVDVRSCNNKPFIVSPVATTAPTCPSTCTISKDSRTCSCAVAACPTGLVACTPGNKQAPICVTPNKVYGVAACTVFTCPAVYAALDQSKACVAAAPVPAPAPGQYQG